MSNCIHVWTSIAEHARRVMIKFTKMNWRTARTSRGQPICCSHRNNSAPQEAMSYKHGQAFHHAKYKACKTSWVVLRLFCVATQQKQVKEHPEVSLSPDHAHVSGHLHGVLQDPLCTSGKDLSRSNWPAGRSRKVHGTCFDAWQLGQTHSAKSSQRS